METPFGALVFQRSGRQCTSLQEAIFQANKGCCWPLPHTLSRSLQKSRQLGLQDGAQGGYVLGNEERQMKHCLFRCGVKATSVFSWELNIDIQLVPWMSTVDESFNLFGRGKKENKG